MRIIKDEIQKNLDVSVALMILDDSMLERIIKDPAQPLIGETLGGYSREKFSMYDTKTSLIDLLEAGKARGAKRIDVSYDFFFGGDTRKNFPDSELTVKAYKVIHDVAKKYGIGFSASIVSPLDSGGGYVKTHENAGFTMQYKEGLIREDGSYEVDMDLQTQWTNNKGPMHLTLHEVKVYAFNEERIGDTPYFYVNPDEIADISSTASYEKDEKAGVVSRDAFGHGDIHIHGKAEGIQKDRCFVVLIYKTVEIDYFAEDALSYMKSIIDLHHEKGITYEGFYADEMHIQADWDMIEHFAETEVNTRYMTRSMAKAFAQMYGAEFEDFAKYLIYFAYKHHTFLPGEEGQVLSQHVFGKTEDDIVRTWQFRNRYYELLHRQVVNLCLRTKEHAEKLFGNTIMTTGHSTWQECPTADRFYGEQNFSTPHEGEHSLYDYTPEFVWSASIRENMAACHDHFKWSEYLCCIGTDIPEGGFLDRNYYGAAFTSGLAVLNRFPMAYYCIWGSPVPVKQLLGEVGLTYGHYANYFHNYEYGHHLIQSFTTRLSEILTVCPMNLNSVEERFGSWMVQYGYTDYITEEKLLEFAHKPSGKHLHVKDRKYNALVVTYSPLMSKEALMLISDYVKCGGCVIWCSSPALLKDEGEQQLFKDIFGLESISVLGKQAKNATVRFDGFDGVSDMEILTDFRPDFTYPVKVGDAKEAAFINGACVGAVYEYEGGGKAVYLGLRVRDDQSASTGKDVDTLFRILLSLGCYDQKGPEASSRPRESAYIFNRFPNGTVSLANHSRYLRELGWDRGFYRDEEKDNEFLKDVSLPSRSLNLTDDEILGHKITYSGDGIVSYRYSQEEGLLGLVGKNTNGIAVDGKSYVLTDEKCSIAWLKLDKENLAPGILLAYAVKCDRAGKVRLPFDSNGMKCAKCADFFLNPLNAYPFTPGADETVVEIMPDACETWIVFYR
ncbi:MAG: hypothetical protein IJB99_08335 [Clostridia bacterium]|nr:hypothetical protein [Clostridia bacterium]